MTAKNLQPQYRLLTEFEGLFRGKTYRHRSSTHGDFVAMHLYEDLLSIRRSGKYLRGVTESRERVVNAENKRHGVSARRGDGTLGQIIPGESPVFYRGYGVGRGRVATLEIGVEVKILAKAMIKQIDRVTNDLKKQVEQFRRGGGDPICVGIVGINQAEKYVSYEGDKLWPTTGRNGYLHPSQEAGKAEERLERDARPDFDEFLLIRFRATNEAPFPFEWVDLRGLRLDYGAVLARISEKYEKRF